MCDTVARSCAIEGTHAQENLQMKKVSTCQTQADIPYSDEDLKLSPTIAMPLVKLPNIQVAFHCEFLSYQSKNLLTLIYAYVNI